MAPPLVQWDLEVMTPREVAALCQVEPKTVAVWADEGKLAHFKTAGGHRRYRRADVEAFHRERLRRQRRGIW